MDTGLPILYVRSAAELEALCSRLQGRDWLAMDTEFHRDKTYFPKLCLLQVATPELVACIDPMALADLEPLLGLIYDPAVTKVMHAARQDLEIFYHLRDQVPGPVFDTQLAAPLLAYPERAGYATLVAKILGVSLDKAYTRADWTRRPLPQEQLRYAIDDVRYLVPVFERMREELQARGRLPWLEEDFAALTDPALYQQPAESAWIRIGGAERLDGVKLAVLQGLASWRERTAQQEDLPRSWIIRDDTLMDLARLLPRSRQELGRLRGGAERALQRYGEQILAVISRARLHPAMQPSPGARPPILTPEQDALTDCLMAVVRLRAHEQGMSSGVLANRRDLERLVLGERDVLRGWRDKMVGTDLSAMLRGDTSLFVAQGTLRLADRS